MSSYLVNGSKREPFGRGDVLFVPAGGVDRFENLSPDSSTWLFFHGSEGGEPDQKWNGEVL
jgi:hypothetical protein